MEARYVTRNRNISKGGIGAVSHSYCFAVTYEML